MTTEQPTFITVREFVAALDGSVNKNTVYAALRRKEIPSVRIGRRWLIPEDALTQMLAWPRNGPKTLYEVFTGEIAPPSQ